MKLVITIRTMGSSSAGNAPQEGGSTEKYDVMQIWSLNVR